MAIARNTDAEKIQPLGKWTPGITVRRGRLGATTAAGELVMLQSDGKWDPAIATAVVQTVGVSIQAGADTEEVDIVRFGPVECLTGATPGATVYVSDTAGEPSETAGTKSTVVGYAETATILFVQPQTVAFS